MQTHTAVISTHTTLISTHTTVILSGVTASRTRSLKFFADGWGYRPSWRHPHLGGWDQPGQPANRSHRIQESRQRGDRQTSQIFL